MACDHQRDHTPLSPLASKPPSLQINSRLPERHEFAAVIPWTTQSVQLRVVGRRREVEEPMSSVGPSSQPVPASGVVAIFPTISSTQLTALSSSASQSIGHISASVSSITTQFSSSSSPSPSNLSSSSLQPHSIRAGRIAGAVVGSLVACALLILIFLHTRRTIYRKDRQSLKFVEPGSKSKLDLAEAQTYHPQISEIRGRPEPFTFNMFPDPGLNSLGEKVGTDLQTSRRPQSLPAPLISSRWPLPIPAAFRMSSPAPISTVVQVQQETMDAASPTADIEAVASGIPEPENDKGTSRVRASRVSFASTSDSGSQGSMVIGSKRFWAAIGSLKPPRILRRSRQL